MNLNNYECDNQISLFNTSDPTFGVGKMSAEHCQAGNPKGEDFRCVLEEIARVIDPEVHVPSPKNGKWTNAGCLDGNGWSIAWCVRNAANEGVPQRRRRVFLVADFTGNSATKILFEQPCVSWHYKTIRETFEETSRSLEERIVSASEYIRSGVTEVDRGIKQKNS